MASDNKHKNDHQHLLQELQTFTTRHIANHVPLALVTSGGTAAPLEHNCVRYLDNFSTGTRGAYAVEEFCKRGYAVIHLKREGSVCPFGRILSGVLKCGKGGPSFDTFGALFDCSVGFGGADENEDDEDVNEDELDDTTNTSDVKGSNHQQHHRGELSLNPKLADSPLLQSTLRTYQHIKHQGLLLTIDFRTVDDYLQKLQLCSESLSICKSLALVYLAAAVSDFYVPEEKKALHKIQSRDYGIKSQASSSVSSFGGEENSETESTMQIQPDNTLTLTLYPVPKVIPSLRKQWCPDAFVVSFKLETDASILKQKSVMAMERNDVHLVIGNELHTRYEKVFVLSRKSGGFIDTNDEEGALPVEDADLPEGYHIAEVTAAHGLAMSNYFMRDSESKNVDALEYATIEYVARHHSHYISSHMNVEPNVSSQQLHH